MSKNDIIIKPVITEKMTELGETLNRFGFIVDKRANKLEIKEAVEATYGVSVDAVKTMNIPGKRKNRYTKTAIVSGMTPPYKKAVVTLAEGDTIDLYSNV